MAFASADYSQWAEIGLVISQWAERGLVLFSIVENGNFNGFGLLAALN